MEKEQGPLASSADASAPSNTITTTSTVSTTNSTTNNTRQTVPQISVYGGIPDRQTVQVIQQALNRQPNTAAQYLQQMYAAQQQHLMLQTAALQQQQLSLAAVQQASIVAGRQSSSQNGATSQQTVSSQTTINLAASPAAAQLISRAQSGNSAPASIAQQAVLLGNTSNPTLTASQAQMYLRAQMAQQNNLVQVARSLGRAVPLSPQLIFTPTATVATVQPEVSTQSINQQSASAQVKNLALRCQQGAVSSPSQTQLQSLSLNQSPAAGLGAAVQPGVQLKSQGQGPQAAVPKTNPTETPLDSGKKNESANELTTRMVNVSRNVTTVTSHPLINTAYTQIQTHQLLQQHKQQFVIQQQPQLSQSQAQILQTASIQPNLQTQAHTVQAVAVQPQSQQCPMPVLPKLPAPCQQATIFHSTMGPQVLSHNGQASILNQTKAKPVHITAVNLQIQPALTQATVPTQDCASKDKPAPLAVREICPTPSEQETLSLLTQEAARLEQCQYGPNQPTDNQHEVWECAIYFLPFAFGAGNLKPRTLRGNCCAEQRRVLLVAVDYCTASTERVNVNSGVGSPPAMTSGNGNNAPTVTGSTPQNGESKPPQAIVKPQILTHVIEGFVIQEGAEPFPVERPLLLIENLRKQKQQTHSDSEKQNEGNISHTADSEMEDLSQQDLKNQGEEPTLACELCGKVDFAYNFKRSKRFCSTVCAKRYNVGCTKRIGLFPNRRTTLEKLKKQRSSNNSHQNSLEAKKQIPNNTQQSIGGSVSSPHLSHPSQGESSQCSDMSSYEEPPSPLSAASSGAQRHQHDRGTEHAENHGRDLPVLTQHFLPSDPVKWNVEDVYEFICSLPGCQEIAEEFRSQEIDGQALLLLKEDHLMSTMNIKLGPALKIFARISMLKDS
ncbi:polyhomeotic-like protein 2 [Chanos chanos]|uniref:Polyhomeotic-like protein 2 n=1 Tax=Chanos chanos TaxID=29144 RepID=A0A6J2UV49_CHACN|nr:polyhomeotic-like protein 2 [Chanos chanos]